MISRLFVGGVFVYASFYKIIEPATFAKSIWFYHLLPGSLINITALVMPWLELICGLALIFGIFYRGAVLWANLMLLLFIVALGSTVARGISVDCGCFKAAAATTDSAWNTIWWDLLYLFFAGQMWLSRSRRWQLQKKS